MGSTFSNCVEEIKVFPGNIYADIKKILKGSQTVKYHSRSQCGVNTVAPGDQCVQAVSCVSGLCVH